MKKNKIRFIVFVLPILLLIAGMFFSLTAKESFTEVLNRINTGLLSRFGWLYSLTTLTLLCVCVALMLSPFGKIRIGGKNARSKLRTRDVFSITLCSIAGIGLVTWGTAEIMAHYSNPPKALGILPYSDEAANFAMETVLLHWTFPAYATYALPAVLFAFLLYNMKRPFSVSEYFYPILGKRMNRGIRGVIDMLCIFTLLCGMSGTIGTTTLSLLGGLSYLSNGEIHKTAWTIGTIVIVIVATFVISSITGIMKGIRFLSNMNLYFFVGLAVFTFICGPTYFILNYGTEAIGNLLQDFFPAMLRTNAVNGDDWSYKWSIFYWAAYMAWAPISAMFIAKVCYGQTIRKIIVLTLVGPSMFTGAWMSIFSGISMYLERHGAGIADAYAKGYEYTAYAVFEYLPFTIPIIVIFLFIAAISVITASDSATDAMAGLVLQEKNIEESTPEQSKNGIIKNFIKIIFGIVIASITFIVVTYSDIGGIKMISTIGAFPALWIEIVVIIGIVKIAIDPEKYAESEEDKK